jgi:hypothetical protein
MQNFERMEMAFHLNHLAEQVVVVVVLKMLEESRLKSGFAVHSVPFLRLPLTAV